MTEFIAIERVLTVPKLPKIKWKVSEPPTGRYRSFEVRSWPSAFYADGRIAAYIRCTEEYRPAQVKVGSHPVLHLSVADYSVTPGFVWRDLVMRFKTLPEVKAALITFLEHYTSYIPKDLGIN